MKKRIVSLLLAALLFVTLLPAEALAYVGNVNKEGPLCNRTRGGDEYFHDRLGV